MDLKLPAATHLTLYQPMTPLVSYFGRMLSVGTIHLKIGSALAERAGQVEVGGSTALPGSYEEDAA